jgi:hypothetical protein
MTQDQQTADEAAIDKKFKEIMEQCKIYPFFKKSLKAKTKEGGKYCRLQDTPIHYELVHYDSVDMIGIELHIGKERIDLLKKPLKYFIGIGIFDKQIMYHPHWGNDDARIYILCDYSMDLEKIFSYLNEFIHQTRGRIDLIVPDWDKI